MFNGVIRLRTGMVPMLELRGEGCRVAPSATALISPTYETTNPATVRGITFTVGGVNYTVDAACASSLAGSTPRWAASIQSEPSSFTRACQARFCSGDWARHQASLVA